MKKRLFLALMSVIFSFYSIQGIWAAEASQQKLENVQQEKQQRMKADIAAKLLIDAINHAGLNGFVLQADFEAMHSRLMQQWQGAASGVNALIADEIESWKQQHAAPAHSEKNLFRSIAMENDEQKQAEDDMFFKPSGGSAKDTIAPSPLSLSSVSRSSLSGASTRTPSASPSPVASPLPGSSLLVREKSEITAAALLQKKFDRRFALGKDIVNLEATTREFIDEARDVVLCHQDLFPDEVLKRVIALINWYATAASRNQKLSSGQIGELVELINGLAQSGLDVFLQQVDEYFYHICKSVKDIESKIFKKLIPSYFPHRQKATGNGYRVFGTRDFIEQIGTIADNYVWEAFLEMLESLITLPIEKCVGNSRFYDCHQLSGGKGGFVVKPNFYHCFCGFFVDKASKQIIFFVAGADHDTTEAQIVQSNLEQIKAAGKLEELDASVFERDARESNTPVNTNEQAELQAAGGQKRHSAIIVDACGNTSWHRLAANRKNYTVDFWIRKFKEHEQCGCINIKNVQGMTLLHIAAYRNDVNLCKALLSRGALVSLRDNNGHLPLDIAVCCGHNEVLQMLLDHGFPGEHCSRMETEVGKCLKAAVENGDIETVKILCACNKSNEIFSQQDDKGNTLLHIAAQRGHAEVVAFILDKTRGGDLLFVYNKERRTALHIAVACEHVSVAAALLSEMQEVSDWPAFINGIICENKAYGEIIAEALVMLHLSPQNFCTLLMNVFTDGDTCLFEILIAMAINVYGYDINKICDENGNTLLHDAVRRWHNESVSILLNAGASGIIKNKSGESPLAYVLTSEQGNAELLINAELEWTSLLLRHGRFYEAIRTIHSLVQVCGNRHKELLKANVESYFNGTKKKAERKLFATALATVFGDKEEHQYAESIIPVIGANIINLKEDGKVGNSLLHVAIENGATRIVELLLKNGANKEALNEEAQTPLLLAINLENSDIVSLLLQHGVQTDVGISSTGVSPLSLAALHRNHSIMKLLLNGGACMAIPNKAGITPLHFAVKYRDHDMVKLLLEHAFKTNDGQHGKEILNLCDNDGSTPLLYAVASNNEAIAKTLIDAGADVTIASKSGASPLYLAAYHGYSEAVKLLLQHGANINDQRYKEGSSPLHAAAEKENMGIIKILLDVGANKEIRDKKGKTPLFVAVESGRLQNTVLLLCKGASTNVVDFDGNSLLHAAVFSDSVQVVQQLLRCKGGAGLLNAKNNKGDTPLILSVDCETVDVLKLLLAAGADPDLTNNDGDTLLHVAADAGSCEKIIFLLELNKNQNINVQNNFGETALHYAAESGQVDAVRLLLELGADPLIEAEYGNTAKDSAYERRDNLRSSKKNKKGFAEHIEDCEEINRILFERMNKKSNASKGCTNNKTKKKH